MAALLVAGFGLAPLIGSTPAQAAGDPCGPPVVSVIACENSLPGTPPSDWRLSSGATAPTTAANELALGFYLDSGFAATLAAGTGFVARANVSPTSDIEFLAEDQIVGLGATPSASVRTGARTTWLMATVVLKQP